MPPKRGKSSQIEKAVAAPSPQRANSRRKQAPQPEEEVVSPHAATTRRSRGTKLKEEPVVQEILQPSSAKKTEKPKGRTTRASQLSVAEDEPKPQAKGTPKKTITPKRNSRQKKIVEPSDSDYEGETVLPLSSPKIAKQSKKSNKNAKNAETDVASMKHENTSEAPEISEKLRGRQFGGKFQADEADVCQDASYNLEEDSAKIPEAAVKSSPVKRGRKSRGQFNKEIGSQEEDNHNETAVDKKVDAGTERDIAGDKVDEKPMKSNDKQENVSSKRGPPKRGKRATRATSVSNSEEIMGFHVENKSLTQVEDPEKITADVKKICESEEIVSQEQGSDKHTMRNICNEAVEMSVNAKKEREVPCKETAEAMDIKEQVIMRIKSDEVDSGAVEEDVIMKEEEANEINKDGEGHTSKVDVFDASGDETKVEEGETDGDSVSTGSLEKCSKGGDSSEGFEGFEIDNSQKGETVSLREITLRQQLDLSDEQVISLSKHKNEDPTEDLNMEVDGASVVDLKHACESNEELKMQEEKCSEDVEQTVKQVLEDNDDLNDDDASTTKNETFVAQEVVEYNSKSRVRRSGRINAQEQRGTEPETVTSVSSGSQSTSVVETRTQAGRSPRSQRAAVEEMLTKGTVEVDSEKIEVKPNGRRSRSQRIIPGAKNVNDSNEIETKLSEADQKKVEEEVKTTFGKKQRVTQKSDTPKDVKSENLTVSEEGMSIGVSEERIVDDNEHVKKEIMEEAMEADAKEHALKNEEVQEHEPHCDGTLVDEGRLKVEKYEMKKVDENQLTELGKDESKSENITSGETEVVDPKPVKKEDIKPSCQETVGSTKERPRKSRWDDPRKLEERLKTDPIVSVNEGITTTVSSSAVPVKIITTKKELKSDKEITWTAEDEAISVTEPAVQKYESVVIITNTLYSRELHTIGYTGNHLTVNIISADDLSPEALVEEVKRNKEKFPQKSLWILVCGIYDIAGVSQHPDCQQCNFVLKQLITTDVSCLPLESVAYHLQDKTSRFNKVHQKIQRMLEPNGVFILSPPIPLLIAVEEAFHNHPTLHRACRLNYSFCATVKTVQALYVSYNMFCDVWTKLACEWMSSLLPDEIFQNFRTSNRNLNLVGVTEIREHVLNPKHSWAKMMRELMNVVSSIPFPTKTVSIKKSQMKKDGMFKRAVVIGNVKYLDNLKQLTSSFPISFIDEDVYFDEDGMNLLKEQQASWPPNTICIILTGVSCIAEALETGPKCIRASCDTPLPVFVPKNHPEGSSEYYGMNTEEMVNHIVNTAFEFAQNTIDFLKDGSALFLAPIMPLRAVWGGKQSKLSHDALHKLVESDSVPVFGASQNEWLKCTQALEDKWIQMTMENLDPISEAYSLYEEYLKEKTDILQYIVDSSDRTDNFRNTWSNLVCNILKDFLYSHEVQEESQLLPSEYSDLLEEAHSYYSEELFHGNSKQSENYGTQKYDDKEMEDSGNWKDQSNSYNSTQSSYQNNQNSSYGDQNFGYQGQNYPPFQGVDPSFSGGAPWMGGPPPPWASGPPPSFHQGPPHGPPTWGPAPHSQWMSGPPMWGAGPPPGPPPAWGAGGMPPWSAAPPPPPSWTSGPPPPVTPSVSSAPAPAWQSVPPPQSGQLQTQTLNKESDSSMPATNIMIQNVTTEMKIEQAKKLLELFGEMTYLKWPLDHLNKPAKFLMACYALREDAEKCARVVNYVKPFGKDSEVKVVGSSISGDKGDSVTSQDLREVSLVQDLLNKIKDDNSVKIKENSNRVVVANISSLIPRKVIDALFLSLRANRSFKNFDLSVISSEEELHYFVCGSVLNVKMMDGYRFPDKKLKVKLVGPDEDKTFSSSEMEAARREIELLMKKYVDSIADLTATKYINKKVNIYTFKTVRCQNEKNCKNPGLCHDYHMWKDRRRCPILFRYSDEMCPNLDSNGKCPAKDKCSKAHSPLEIPFHLKNFRAHICTSARKKGYCNKTDKICAYLHPGTTEAFYDRQWRDVYVEGLDRSITYFVGAIMNLFKVSKQNCVRVLLITPAPELVTFLVKSMEALSFSCDQEIAALSPDGKAKKATILVGTPQAVINWMAEGKRSKNVNLDRLKALIVDDGPSVVDFIEMHGHNFLIEFAKIKDLNKVITAEKINRQDVTALERLRILTDYKKIYQKEDRSKRSPSPRGRSPSPKRSSQKDHKSSSSSGRDSHMDDDRQRYSREREKEKYLLSAESKQYDRDRQYEEQLRQEIEKEEVMREQEGLLREQLKLKEQIRREEELKREEELRREQKMRHDLQMMQEREEQMRHDQEMKREQERRQEQERLELEKKKKDEAKARSYQKFMAAKEDLKREHERERKLYLELPEVHPEYEEKYRVFLDQYKTHYPGRNDAEHRNKLWMLFWKELVSSMLETAYKKKREILEMEYLRSQGGEQSEVETSSLKRKAPSDSGKGSSKFPRSEEFDQSRPGTSSGNMVSLSQGLTSSNVQTTRSHYSQGASSLSSQPSAFLGASSSSSQFSQTSSSSVSVPQAVAIINEVCECLGDLSPAIRLVLQKIHAVNMDPLLTGKVFTDSDNAMIMKIAAAKMKEASEKYTSPIKEKLVLASYQAMQLLEMPAAMPPAQKKPYHGLDIQKVARATFDKDPAFIVQFIKNALLYEGVENPSQDDISDIFVTITNTHFSMANN
ncbi:uncharacterized protein LOC135205603 isoform X2 [Macrobrachium nipponense]|uniref:uncharacterized protein LOC135205603 isoform X2 n=1 Tax=Macrobrachium nipponense TaxID=159736 RepID=UPI0030C82AB9